jgi:hypothetical protein
MDINAAGPLRIYKALAPLLFKSSAPKVIGITSPIAAPSRRTSIRNAP